jgi:hypothetical protein
MRGRGDEYNGIKEYREGTRRGGLIELSDRAPHAEALSKKHKAPLAVLPLLPPLPSPVFVLEKYSSALIFILIKEGGSNGVCAKKYFAKLGHFVVCLCRVRYASSINDAL